LRGKAKQEYLRAALKNYHANPPEEREGNWYQAKATQERKAEARLRNDAADAGNDYWDATSKALDALRKSIAEAVAATK